MTSSARTIEITEFVVAPGREADFAQAMHAALPILDRQPGMLCRQFGYTIEVQRSFFLLVEWRQLADHIEQFRGSSDFDAFVGHLRLLLDKPARVVHINVDHA